MAWCAHEVHAASFEETFRKGLAEDLPFLERKKAPSKWSMRGGLGGGGPGNDLHGTDQSAGVQAPEEGGLPFRGP